MKHNPATMLLPALLLAISPTLSNGEAPVASKDGLTVEMQLMDGLKWTLAEGGVGRPYMVWMKLKNESEHDVTLWDPHNSEGAQCPHVILTDANGKETIFTPRGIPRLAGMPTVWVIKPHGWKAIELDLLRLIGEKSPAPGKYSVRVRYENTQAGGGRFSAVWTGSIETQPAQIEIIRPAAAGQKP